MTLRHIEIFVAVCECGKTTVAADKLHIAQPAVSRALSQLEYYYGVRLFDRTGLRLALTDVGRSMFVRAKQILDDFAAFELLAKDACAKPTVRVGATLTIGKTFIPTFVGAVRSAVPDVDLRVFISSAAVAAERISDGTVDFAFAEGDITRPDIICEPFGSDMLVAVCGKSYDADDCIYANEFAAHSWLLREKGSASRAFWDGALSARGTAVTPTVESYSNQALIAACAAGLGIAVLPYELVRAELENGTLRRIDPDGIELTRRSFIAFHRNRVFTAAARNVLELARGFAER